MNSVALPTGWSPSPNPTESSSEVTATQRLLQEYPGTTAIRKFFQSATGVSATNEALAYATSGMRVAISIPGTVIPTNAEQVVYDLANRGIDTDFIMIHEPEKKVTPAQYLDTYTRLNQVFPRAHELRAAQILRIVSVMTVQRARVYQPSDLRLFVTPQLAALIDVMGWDWYVSSAPKSQVSTYEDPEDALGLMISFSDEINVPQWGIYEFNHERIMTENGFAVDLDPDGTMCADWYNRMYQLAKNNGCKYWTHFHKGGGDLTLPGDPRIPEYNTLKLLISESNFTPDPNHPQYIAGKEVGLEEGKIIGFNDGKVLGIAEGTVTGKNAAYNDVIAYCNSKLQ